MVLATFLLKAVWISMSGVLMPGPVTAVTVAKGSDSPHAGALIAIGHGLIEFPLMILLGFTLSVADVFQSTPVKVGIGLFGGGILLWMGVGMLKTYKSAEVGTYSTNYSAVTAGALLSLSNPYFLIFWATVGTTLIINSLGFGLMGFVLFAIVHWMADLIWYYFLSALTYRGGKFFGRKLQQGIFLFCGFALLYFGGSFLVDAVYTWMPSGWIYVF